MNSLKNVNVYVLEDGKYVLKTKQERLASAAKATRSQVDKMSESSNRQHTVQGDFVTPQARGRCNYEQANSVVVGKRSDYVPKHFVSRKVNLKNDVVDQPKKTINVETVVYHTPVKAQCAPFNIVFDGLFHRSPEEFDDASDSTPRQNQSVYESDRELIRARDKEIGTLKVKVEQLKQTNRELSDRLAYTERFAISDNRNNEQLECLRHQISEINKQNQLLKALNSQTESANYLLKERIKSLERVHESICLEILFMKGLTLSQDQIMNLCMSAESFGCPKRAEGQVAKKLEKQVARLSTALQDLEDMLVNGQLTQSMREEIQNTKKEFEFEKTRVSAYLDGASRKQHTEKILSSLMQKNKAESRLVEKLVKDGRMKDSIIAELVQCTQNLIQEKGKSQSQSRREVETHAVRNMSLSCIETQSVDTSKITNFKYIVLNAQLNQALSKKQISQSQTALLEADLLFKEAQQIQLKAPQTTEYGRTQLFNTKRNRIRQLESQIAQLKEDIENSRKHEPSLLADIEQGKEELKKLGTMPNTSERGGRQRSLESPVKNIHQLQQSLRIIRKIVHVDQLHKRVHQMQRKTHRSVLEYQYHLNPKSLTIDHFTRLPCLTTAIEFSVIPSIHYLQYHGIDKQTRNEGRLSSQMAESILEYSASQWNKSVISNQSKYTMESLLTRCFVEATKENTELLTRHCEILIMNVFNKRKSLLPEDNRLVALTDRFLVYYKDDTKTKVKRICEITFDCKFQILRELSKETKSVGLPIGIKFQKSGFEPVELYSPVPSMIQLWKEQLEKLMNQRGFHSLFRPIKKIGKGNFASVYLAQRLQDRKMVAVKAFSKESIYSQEKGKESLMNEIKLLRKLGQPNIMKLYAVYESDNSIYMTMELVEGGQLFTKIQSKHVFTHDQVKQIMKGLLQGLEHMHSKRIMHRDLKPENILLRSGTSCQPVIADFGLATWADEPEYLFVRCGTPGYVAPEIINIRDMKTKSQPICDIFSVGLIFHILLLGRSIFPGKTYNDVLSQNRACDFFLDSPEYQSLGYATHNLLKSMLEKSPNKRITAAEALIHPYFGDMEIEQAPQKQLYLYPETPLKVVDENKPSQFGWNTNKASVFAHRDDTGVFKNITNNDMARVSMKFAPSNYASYYPQQLGRRYSNDIHMKDKQS